MSKIRILLAESSDIMLNGLHQTLLTNAGIEICGKATRYNTLCRMIEEIMHDMVLVGPLICKRYPQDMKTSLMVKYPGIKLVEIEIEENQEGLLEKIHEATRASIY